MQIEKEYTVGREINAIRCESVGEYSLPDYNGDVKRVLFVKAQAFPSGKFVGEETLEFSGTVGYEVVYVDGENNVTHTEFSTDYEAAVRINTEKYVDSDVKTEVCACNIRLVGPRKFSVKCSLDSDVRLSERRTHSVEGDAFSEYEPEIATNTVRIFASECASGEEKEFSEQIHMIEGAIADEVEILLCDVREESLSLERTDDGVEVKANVFVDLLFKDSDNSLRRVSKEIPYTSLIACESAFDVDGAEARLEVLGRKARVNPTDDGVDLTASFTVVPKVYLKGNTSVEIVSDAYLKERGTENEYSELGYMERLFGAEYRDKFAVNHSISELDLDGISDILYSDASVKSEEVENDGETVKISGEIRFSAIACQVSDDGGNVYTSLKFSEPYVYNANLNCQNMANMRLNHALSSSNAKIEVVNGEVEASCDVLVRIDVNSDKRQRCLGASYVTEEEYERDDSVITVYYPDATESLFEIAKKFHTSTVAIAESNRLTETVFASSHKPLGTLGVGKLLIK